MATWNGRTIVYCNDDGNNTDGTTWANAYTTLSAAITAATASTDVIFVGHDHAESQATQYEIDGPADLSEPLMIIRVNTSTNVYDNTSSTTNISITTANDVIFGGNLAIYGLRFYAGRRPIRGGPPNQGYMLFKDVHFIFANGQSTYVQPLGVMQLRDCTFDVSNDTSNTSNEIFSLQQINLSYIEISGCVVAGGQYRSIFLEGGNWGSTTKISGCDFSSMTGNPCYIVGDFGAQIGADVSGCILGPNMALQNNSTARQINLMVGSDTSSGGDENRIETAVSEGVVTTESTIVRTGGNSNSRSFAMTTNTYSNFGAPLSTPYIYTNVTTSNTTVEVYFTHSESAVLTDADIWLELEYLQNASDTQREIQSTACAPAATPSSLSTTTETWGGSETYQQKIAMSISPAQSGMARARVMLAKASAEVYVDAYLAVS